MSTMQTLTSKLHREPSIVALFFFNISTTFILSSAKNMGRVGWEVPWVYALLSFHSIILYLCT